MLTSPEVCMSTVLITTPLASFPSLMEVKISITETELEMDEIGLRLR